jgi:hypothetical protein
MTEGDVVNSCLRYLLMQGCHVWRNNSGGYKPEGSKRFIRFGAKGSPDIIGLTSTGRFIGCECKFGKGKPTPEQIAFGNEIMKRGGIYVVAYSVDDLIPLKDVL